MKPLLTVEGYNAIGAWPEAAPNGWSIEECLDRLLHALQDYGGYIGEEIVLVFDGYQSDRRVRTEDVMGNVTVVFTMRNETADSYIERLVAETPRYRSVRVATSDGLEQSQVLSTGAARMTSRELLRELRQTRQQGYRAQRRPAVQEGKNISDQLPGGLRERLEKMRRGK